MTGAGPDASVAQAIADSVETAVVSP
jgi:hypothetical protein